MCSTAKMLELGKLHLCTVKTLLTGTLKIGKPLKV